MSFRNRPVLDRKHRPRWQDELRSQQLIVAGFALAIAVAVGIFGAVAWSSFYNDNLRQVALVQGIAVDRSDLARRTDLIAAELTARLVDLQSQLGGVRDQVIQSQIQQLQTAISSIEEVASDSLVTGLVMEANADDFGVSVDEQAIDAELQERRTLPERVKLSLILVQPQVAEDAPEDAEPTEQDWQAARAEVEQLKAQLDGGADWATLASEHSDDSSAQTRGVVGWVAADDSGFGEYFAAAGEAAPGEVLGPLRSDRGWYLLRVDDRRPAGPNENLEEFLRAAGATDQDYRAYVRQELLQGQFQDYFRDVVIGRYAPQRHVAQIHIAVEGEPALPNPQVQIRHLLAQPLPGEEDQSGATPQQWRAARERAMELREAAQRPDADWYALARRSDDAGSRTRGGSLGWHDPATLDTQFVAAFAEAVRGLQVGELSEPVRSEFGYHVIEVTDRRVSPAELANRLVVDLEEDPDSFERVARDYSEDPVTAAEGGDLGWVLPYQFEAVRQEAIFGLTEPGQVSQVVEGEDGLYIFKLIASSEARFVPADRREEVANSGFSRWLVELQDQAGVWVDPALAPVEPQDGGGDGTTPVLP
ncbi:MAG TPA: peptidylprolyl isomerase [Candidatus Limnocylindria bacterium]|nr:peptidylprolyl isomerase [Candidatus Limnocylindria bacterium]